MIDHSGGSHGKYLSWANWTVGLAGKDVVEIGGCSPVAQIRRFSPRSWMCINLDPMAVAAFNRDASQQQCAAFVAVAQDAAKLEVSSRFSVAYSINAFEHIADLRTTLDRVQQSLIPGGVLFTVFGPIWSADIGHHLSIPTDQGPLGMFDGILQPWEHLTSTPAQICERIEPRLGAKTARRVIEYVFNYPDLNRLTESDYASILRASDLRPVLVFRHKSRQRPPEGCASRTRELLWLLKKGPASSWDKASAALRFTVGFASTRLNNH